MRNLLDHIPTAARIGLGLAFLVFGLNGFFNFLPMPPHHGGAGAFLGALAATGFMFPLIKGTEVLVGLLLLSNRAVPLALTLLAPVMVNIVAFHAAFEPASIGMPLALLSAHLYLTWAYRKHFAGVLTLRAQPLAPHLPAAQHPASV
jgi:hypothetical protein